MSLNRFDEIFLKHSKAILNKYNFTSLLNPCKLISFLKDYKFAQESVNKELLNNDIYTEKYNVQTIEEFYEFWKAFAKFLPHKKQKYINKNFIIPKRLLDNVETRNSYKYQPIKNKICYCINHSLPYRSDGYATRSKYVAESLSKDFEVIVITNPGYPWNTNNIKKDIPMIDTLNNVVYRRQKIKKAKTSKKRLQNIINSWKKSFIEEKPEYVIGASNYANAYPALIAAKSLGIPFYYEVRGFWEVSEISRDKEYAKNINYLFKRFFETKVCQLSDGVFTLTTAMKQELIERGVEENKIYLTPNCADINLFKETQKDKELMTKLNISEDDVVIGYIGTIQMYEGLDDLIRACTMFENKNLKYKLLIIGSSPTFEKPYCDEYIKNLAKELGLEDKLIMTGRVPVEEVSKYYSLIDITPFGRKDLPVCDLVSPIKPLEAMAMKKAVIVSSLRALTEIVKNEITGLHFEKGNPQSYAKVLERAILDKDLRLKLGENASIWIKENRQWEQNTKLIKKILEK